MPNLPLPKRKQQPLTLQYEEDTRFKPPVHPLCWIVRPKLQPPAENGAPTSLPDERFALLWNRFWVKALARGARSLGLSPDSCYAMPFSEVDGFKVLAMAMVPLDDRRNLELIEPIVGHGQWTGPAPLVVP